MKRKTSWIVCALIYLISLPVFDVSADDVLYTTGIGLRGTIYRMSGHTSQIYVRDHDYQSEINIGGFGGGLFLLSRITETLTFEITIGAIGQVQEHSVFVNEEDVEISAINPLLFGVRFEPGRLYSPSNLSPYITAGAGPYWISDISVYETPYEDEVDIHTRVKHGAYLGAGLDFGVTERFGFNFDVKYHLVALDIHDDHSGFEYGIGFHVTWGDFNNH